MLTFNGLAKKHNTFLIASFTWGCMFATAIMNTLTACGTYLITRDVVSIVIACSIVTTLTMTGCIFFFLKYSFLLDEVSSIKSFAVNVLCAFVFTLIMPFLVVGIFLLIQTSFLDPFLDAWMTLKASKQSDRIFDAYELRRASRCSR